MIPKSVISIGQGAFSGCNSLRRITLPARVNIRAIESGNLPSVYLADGAGTYTTANPGISPFWIKQR